uniref:MADF domain-containing protein n=1 Tax=Parastrongyloides trichosuri TaxID=131310 RepID=A0A0N4ZJA8_PARTI
MLDVDKLKLIECYKSRTVLWKTNHPEYHSQKSRDEALKEIVEDFENKYSQEVIKKEFKNLRDTWVKIRRRRDKEREDTKRTGQPARAITWHFWEPLGFLNEVSVSSKRYFADRHNDSIKDNFSHLSNDFSNDNFNLLHLVSSSRSIKDTDSSNASFVYNSDSAYNSPEPKKARTSEDICKKEFSPESPYESSNDLSAITNIRSNVSTPSITTAMASLAGPSNSSIHHVSNLVTSILSQIYEKDPKSADEFCSEMLKNAYNKLIEVKYNRKND